MPFLQDIMHRLQTGGGSRFFRIGLAVLAILLLTVGYNWRAFHNFATQEAMDAAQIGRNLAQGNGFTTLFIRPFSMYLLRTHKLETQGVPPAGKLADLCEIRDRHPDLANPPVYPLVLAALMKVLPFRYTAWSNKPFWSLSGRFARFQPDFLIALFNQLLLLALVAAIFFLARRLFDRAVAWLSASLLLGTELLWRFSVSGLSTMLLMLVFIGLAWCLVLVEQEARVSKSGRLGIFVAAGLAGAAVGLGALTRYSFIWLIIPVVIFLVLFGGQRRVALALLACAVFAAIVLPWLARNYTLSGKPFGTATYTVVENTILFPESRLERSLDPDLSRLYIGAFWIKFNTNLRQVVLNELPRFSGTGIAAFFLVGLLISFRNPAISRLRYFLLACALVLIVVEALGRTQLSEEVPEINSENLLVLLAPLVLVYGVSLFYLFLDQMPLPLLLVRYLVIGVFSVLACLPMIFVFLPPKATPVAYPPYFPPAIQTVAGWLKPNELAMSDIPWAMAWYGQRQCVWLTLKCTPDAKDPHTHEDFFAINDYQKPIFALYLTPETMDAHFLTQWIKSGEQSWGSFILDCIVYKKVPAYFPLSKSQVGWLPEQLALTDWQHWPKVQQ